MVERSVSSFPSSEAPDYLQHSNGAVVALISLEQIVQEVGVSKKISDGH